MKKFLIPVFLFCTIICLAGCGNKEQAATPANNEMPSPIVEEVQETVVEEPSNEFASPQPLE